MTISDELKERLKAKIENCILNGVGAFYCGCYGDFDSACVYALKEFKEEYPTIKSLLVTPYITPNVQKKFSILRNFIYTTSLSIPK